MVLKRKEENKYKAKDFIVIRKFKTISFEYLSQRSSKKLNKIFMKGLSLKHLIIVVGYLSNL